MISHKLVSCMLAAAVAASAAFSVLPVLSVQSFAAAQTAPYTKYTVTEEELSAAGVEWQGSEKLTVYAKVTQGGMDSKISATAWYGADGVAKTATKCISGRNVLIGNAIQDNIIGLAGTGIYAFPEIKLSTKTQDGSEWSESYESELTVTITIETGNTDCELLGISFDNGAVYAAEQGFSPDSVVTESRSFDIIEKTERDLLKMSIDHCRGFDQEKYLPESWQQLQTALDEATSVFNTEGIADAVYIEARAALEKVRCAMLFADTGTDESPLPYRELTGDQLVYEMGVGINLGNTMDGHSNFSPSETSWQSIKTTKAYIKALHDAGFNTVRIPVTWGRMIDRDTYELNEKWLDRVQQIVDYCVSQDMYAIINIHHDGAEQSGWLRVAAEDIDEVYYKFECVWRNIAERFKNYDEHLIFESMNEITCMKDDKKNSQEAVDKDTPIIVNLNQIFVNVVRSTGGNNDKRWLAAVAHYANSGNHKAFVLPEDATGTPHIMFAAHIYKANTNTTWTYDEVYQVVNGLKMMADKFDVPMYLGEYGNRTKEQEGTATGYNDAARAYFSEVVHRACQTAGVVPVVWDQGYGDKGKYETGLFTYWDRVECIPLFKSITDAMLRGTYLPNSEQHNNWDYTDITESPAIIPITTIKLSERSVDLTVGDVMTIEADTTPANSNDVVLWSTDDESVATVTRGIIRARGIGRTVVRAYSQSGSVVKELTVTVNAAEGDDKITAPAELAVVKGRSQLIGASLTAESDGYLTYKVSNPNIISVSPTGRLFALDSGVAYVTITADSGASSTVRVFVPEKEGATVSVADVQLSADTLKVDIDAIGDSCTLSVETGAAGSIVYFSSENSGVAAVSNITAVVADENGTATAALTAMSVGTTVVTAYTEDGDSVSIEVNVLHETPSAISLAWLIVLIAAIVIFALCMASYFRKNFRRKLKR